MCLTIPRQVISKRKNAVTLKGDPEKGAISLIDVRGGDWVLTQNMVRPGSPSSVIIKKITAKQAKEIFKIIRTYDR